MSKRIFAFVPVLLCLLVPAAAQQAGVHKTSYPPAVERIDLQALTGRSSAAPPANYTRAGPKPSLRMAARCGSSKYYCNHPTPYCCGVPGNYYCARNVNGCTR